MTRCLRETYSSYLVAAASGFRGLVRQTLKYLGSRRMPSSAARKPSLTEGPIARTLLLFSLPILGANVLQSLNASVNMVWIGHYLGEAALTASANANLVLFFLLGLVFGISMANTLLVGQAVGAQNIDQAKRVVGTSVGFFIALSLAV